MEVIYSTDHETHFPQGEVYEGQLIRPFECPERWDHIVAALDAAGFTHRSGPDVLDFAAVHGVHEADYVQFLQNFWANWLAAGHTGEAIPTMFPVRGLRDDKVPADIDGQLGFYALAAETSITPGTWSAVEAAASLAQTAQRRVSAGANNAFALCRPPGHHASANQFGGYCFLNNAAIAAQGFLNDGAQRVAVLDVDFHHGNGTQSIFYNRPEVLFVSLHGDPAEAFPYFLGYADETGQGPGEGANLNLPLPSGTEFAQWAAALEVGCQAIVDYRPDALVVSLGVDTFKDDPISFFKLDTPDYLRIGQRIAASGLPTLYVMEGGYAVEEIGTNTVNVLLGHLNF
jgi:acetoin utilization deacetylase AcuC-like enzyme